VGVESIRQNPSLRSASKTNSSAMEEAKKQKIWEGNVEKFSIIESTLREGEQFANAFFTTDQKVHIAKMLSDFGCEYLELTSPAASEQVMLFFQMVAQIGKLTSILEPA
jgi:hypothetical protein